MDQIISNFHFIRPEWLILIIPGITLPLLFLRKQSQSNQWHKLIDQNLLPFLIDGHHSKVSRIPIIGLIILWILASIAMAGPTWEKRPQPVTEEVSSLVVIWDLSLSMNVTDVKPSRLSRSRLKLIDLLNTRQEGLTGLIAYSGEAHVVTPLTDDTKTIISLLPALSPEIMPAKGSNIEMAFEQALKLLRDSGVDRGEILILTDGISLDAVSEITNQRENASHRVTIWGVGTREGAPIPLPDGGFARDGRNQIIVAKLDEAVLSETAIALKGLYVPMSNDDLDIRTIASFSLNADKSSTRETSREFDLWVEYGPYLVLLILPFAALSFRKGWVICILVGLSFTPKETLALEWKDLWQTQDQQGQKAFSEGDTEKAAEVFKNEDWKAISEYRNKNFESAAEHFKTGDSYTDAFNLGNSLAHTGDFDGAIEAYEKALEKNPDLEEARHNIDIIEKIKKMQQNQNQNQDQNNQQQNQDNEQSQDSQSQDSQSQNGDSQNQQSADQSQNQDSQNSESQGEQSENNENQDPNQTQQTNQNEQQNSEQEQALENQYGKKEEEESLIQNGEENKNQKEDSEKQLAQKTQEESGSEEQKQAQLPQAIEAKTEQQQALEQWLRKVPDDPSGLMRNKFNYEYRKRKQESQMTLRRPNGQNEERW